LWETCSICRKQHAISTEKIRRSCTIFQQVTVGYLDDDCPTTGDNVVIIAGAKVLGDITLGDNSTVGTNAIVVEDVPENCTVVGVTVYIIRRNGIKRKSFF